MGNRVLLVEGPDEQHVMWALFKIHQVPKSFRVVSANGRDRLLDSLAVRLKSSGLERLAVVLDADEDASRRWQQLRDRLSKAGYSPLPESPSPEGTIADLELVKLLFPELSFSVTTTPPFLEGLRWRIYHAGCESLG